MRSSDFCSFKNCPWRAVARSFVHLTGSWGQRKGIEGGGDKSWRRTSLLANDMCVYLGKRTTAMEYFEHRVNPSRFCLPAAHHTLVHGRCSCCTQNSFWKGNSIFHPIKNIFFQTKLFFNKRKGPPPLSLSASPHYVLTNIEKCLADNSTPNLQTNDKIVIKVEKFGSRMLNWF